MKWIWPVIRDLMTYASSLPVEQNHRPAPSSTAVWHRWLLTTHLDWSGVHMTQITTHLDWRGVHMTQITTHLDWRSVHMTQVTTYLDWRGVHTTQVTTHLDWRGVHMTQITTHLDWRGFPRHLHMIHRRGRETLHLGSGRCRCGRRTFSVTDERGWMSAWSAASVPCRWTTRQLPATTRHHFTHCVSGVQSQSSPEFGVPRSTSFSPEL